MNSGDSTLTYKWESPGSTVNTTRFHVISSVAKSDAKAYTCNVTNNGGSKSSSKELTLTVQGILPFCMYTVYISFTIFAQTVQYNFRAIAQYQLVVKF